MKGSEGVESSSTNKSQKAPVETAINHFGSQQPNQKKNLERKQTCKIYSQWGYFSCFNDLVINIDY